MLPERWGGDRVDGCGRGSAWDQWWVLQKLAAVAVRIVPDSVIAGWAQDEESMCYALVLPNGETGLLRTHRRIDAVAWLQAGVGAGLRDDPRVGSPPVGST